MSLLRIESRRIIETNDAIARGLQEERMRRLPEIQDAFDRVVKRRSKVIKGKELGSPEGWRIIVPKNYEQGNMDYSLDDLEEFVSVVSGANREIDSFVKSYIENVERVSRENSWKIREGEWESIEISWNIFALNGFLDNPVFGKVAYFPGKGHLELPRPTRVSFDIVDTGKGFAPFYIKSSDRSVPNRGPRFFSDVELAIESNPAGYNLASDLTKAVYSPE